MSTDTAVDAFVLVSLDEPWPCTGLGHGVDDHRHADGPATHYQFGPCEYGTGPRCGKFIRTLLVGVEFYCSACDAYSPWESHRWVPLTKES